jgi:hypothetical protein
MEDRALVCQTNYYSSCERQADGQAAQHHTGRVSSPQHVSDEITTVSVVDVNMQHCVGQHPCPYLRLVDE